MCFDAVVWPVKYHPTTPSSKLLHDQTQHELALETLAFAYWAHCTIYKCVFIDRQTERLTHSLTHSLIEQKLEVVVVVAVMAPWNVMLFRWALSRTHKWEIDIQQSGSACGQCSLCHRLLVFVWCSVSNECKLLQLWWFDIIAQYDRIWYDTIG